MSSFWKDECVIPVIKTTIFGTISSSHEDQTAWGSNPSNLEKVVVISVRVQKNSSLCYRLFFFL